MMNSITIRLIHTQAIAYGNTTTNHFQSDRTERHATIQAIGCGKIISTFEVDRGHRNGLEIHQITDNGMIIIYNKHSHKLITELIARPNQIIRYYFDSNTAIPYEVLILAQQHEQAHYNRA